MTFRLTQSFPSNYRLALNFRSLGARTDVTGKVVRYLQESEVLVGEPYVEVEAMKMIMPHQGHRESGKITHSLCSVISAGDSHPSS
jgi:hypothetical protein